MRSPVVVALLLAARLATADEVPRVDAEDDSPVMLSVGVGAAAAIIPLCIGGALTTTSNVIEHNAGIYVLQAGLALAPILSHLIAGEWKRAAVFGFLPTASVLAMIAVFYQAPRQLYDEDHVATRLELGGLVILSVFSAGAGLVDSLFAGDRRKERRIARSLTIAPWLGTQSMGLAFGGAL